MIFSRFSATCKSTRFIELMNFLMGMSLAIMIVNMSNSGTDKLHSR